MPDDIIRLRTFEIQNVAEIDGYGAVGLAVLRTSPEASDARVEQRLSLSKDQAHSTLNVGDRHSGDFSQAVTSASASRQQN